jgi:hypothetical protein
MLVIAKENIVDSDGNSDGGGSKAASPNILTIWYRSP